MRPNPSLKLTRYGRLSSNVRSRTIAKTFHVAAGWFVFRTSKACSLVFRYTAQLVFFWVRTSAVAVLSARGYHGILLHHFAMRKASFSSVLAVPVFRSIIGKPFLTRCCSGFATLPAELIR